MPERTPRERETLIFQNPEAAQQFRERVEGRLLREQQPGITKKREAIAQEVTHEFVQAGEAAHSLHQPWEHTPQEHEEVQHLVNIAFAKDLKVALAKSRQSPAYPRNLDLLHDLLTGEMYTILAKHNVNRQPMGLWLFAVVGIIALALLLCVFFFLAP